MYWCIIFVPIALYCFYASHSIVVIDIIFEIFCLVSSMGRKCNFVYESREIVMVTDSLAKALRFINIGSIIPVNKRKNHGNNDY